MTNTLPKTRMLAGWVTGAHYQYTDGEIWPSIKNHGPLLIAWRIALKLGLRNKTILRERGNLTPRLATTMIGDKRAHNIIDVVAMTENIVGDVVDCGVWRGGSTILFKAAIDELGLNKKVWCCDTFNGFPKEDAERENVASPNFLIVPVEEVKYNFRKHGVSIQNVEFLKGKVQNTLASITGPVSILRVDVDMYHPTKHCFDAIVPIMSPGGIIIVDDYGCNLYECKRAVDNFMKDNPKAVLHKIDNDGVYIVLPS